MAANSRIGRIPAISIALWIAACGSEVSPSLGISPPANVDPTGILLVNVGEQVQAAPPTEALKVAFSQATELAEANGQDLGYPWFDPSSGELVFSTVTAHGRDLVDATNIAGPHRIRAVAHGVAELERIGQEVTTLRSQGVPDAERILAVIPDHRDNRVLIVISALSRPLIDALAGRFPVDAIGVRVNPAGLG